MSRNSQGRIHKKDMLRAVCGLTATAVLLIGAFFLISQWEKRAYQKEAVKKETSIEKEQPKTIKVDDALWKQKEHVETYLFLGIDTTGEVEAVDGYYGGGQADVQMILALDHENKTWQILQLNRDTMAEVPILGMQGDVVGTEYQQIALSHSYGNGMEESCENSVNTVSGLLWNQHIDGYYSINMDAIGIINDMTGGVEVTVTSDFSEVDESLKLGETITLQGDQAQTFLRTRKDVDDQTNISRMERQRQYLKALGEKLGTMPEEKIIEIYDAVFAYTVTDMGSKTITEIAEYAAEYKQLEIMTIDGEQVEENGHWAYYLDKDSLQEVILQMFYERK